MDDLLDTAPCGYLTFADDGSIRTANRTLLDLLGFSREDVVGRHLQVLLTPGAKVFYQTHVFPMLKLHGQVEEIYLSLRSSGGENIPMLINARRREIGGELLNQVVLVRMRQRASYEEELLEARNAAQKASKAKDEFLAALSHELRTPLSPVLMISSVMEADASLSSQVREQAGVIRRNAELEARLIDDLLDHTRIISGKLRLVSAPLDLHALLAETGEIVRSDSLRKAVTIEFVASAESHHVSGDAARLQQVCWNLIKNAVKFTPSGGRVRVVTSNPSPDRPAIAVSDTGIGISKEALQRIFEPFEQGGISTQQFGGLGLGLAIARAIVEMHGGSIRAESGGAEKGATFTVEFATLRVSNARVSAPGLPDQTGFDLMRALKAEHQLSGIALSGYGMEEDAQRAREAGFSAHLVKPVAFEQLAALIEQLAPVTALHS